MPGGRNLRSHSVGWAAQDAPGRVTFMEQLHWDRADRQVVGDRVARLWSPVHSSVRAVRPLRMPAPGALRPALTLLRGGRGAIQDTTEGARAISTALRASTPNLSGPRVVEARPTGPRPVESARKPVSPPVGITSSPTRAPVVSGRSQHRHELLMAGLAALGPFVWLGHQTCVWMRLFQ